MLKLRTFDLYNGKSTQSGTATVNRVELTFCGKGDPLIVTRIDRLARSLRDFQHLVYDLKARGIILNAIEQPIDTITPIFKQREH